MWGGVKGPTESSRTQDSPPCNPSSSTPGWDRVQAMFALTLAPSPSPGTTLTFISAFRGNGVARACGLERPQCLFCMGSHRLKNRKVREEDPKWVQL